MHKYHTVEHLASPQYYPHAQQIIAQQTNKTFLSLFNWDSQEVELKISMTESMTVLRFSTDGHYLYGGSQTGTHRYNVRNSLFVGNAQWNPFKEEKYAYWGHCSHCTL